MPRPPRLDFPGAVHHVFVRGNARSAIALDDEDHERALDLLERAASRFELVCHAWCYLPNHSHLLVTSRLGNLSRAMHWLGTCSAHSFNQQARTVRPPLSRAIRIEARGGRCPLRRARAVSPAQSCAGGALSLAGGLALVELRGDRRSCAIPVVSVLGGDHPNCRLGRGYVDWVAGGVDETILDERGFRRPAPRPPLSDLLASGSDDSIARAHAHGYDQVAIAEHLAVSQSQISRRLAAYKGV